MSRRRPSLRWRLLAGTLAWVLLSLVAGWGIQTLFRQHIQAQLQTESGIHLDHLTAALKVDKEGRIALATQPADPRFNNPFSGL